MHTQRARRRRPAAAHCGLLLALRCAASFGAGPEQPSASAHPSLPARPAPRDIVVYADATHDGGHGRFGHAFKSSSSAPILAELFGWRALQPRAFNHIGKVLVPERLGAPAICPPGYARVEIKPSDLQLHTVFQGVRNFTQLQQLVLSRVPADAAQRCVVLVDNFRVPLHSVFAWERKRQVHAGAYEALSRRFLAQVRVRAHNHWVPSAGVVTVVAHMRRGAERVASRQRQRADEVHELVARTCAALPVETRVVLVTQAEGSQDVFREGCAGVRAALARLRPAANESARGSGAGGRRPSERVTCTAVSSSIGRDFAALLAADVLVVSNSGFATAAAHFRARGLVVVPSHTKQFFPCPHVERSAAPPSLVCPYRFAQPALRSASRELGSAHEAAAAAAVEYDPSVLTAAVASWWRSSGGLRREVWGLCEPADAQRVDCTLPEGARRRMPT